LLSSSTSVCAYPKKISPIFVLSQHISSFFSFGAKKIVWVRIEQIAGNFLIQNLE